MLGRNRWILFAVFTEKAREQKLAEIIDMLPPVSRWERRNADKNQDPFRTGHQITAATSLATISPAFVQGFSLYLLPCDRLLSKFFLSLCWHKSALTHTTNLPQRLKSLKFVAAVAVSICLHFACDLQNSDYFCELQSAFIVAMFCFQWIWQTALKTLFEERCHTGKNVKNWPGLQTRWGLLLRAVI